MARLLVALGLLIGTGVAIADPDPERVVLADSDPELRRAVETALRPWRIEVVIDPEVPADTAAMQARADQRAARFVVWRDGDHLVVYDRERGESERRATRAGAFDPVDAAAAALTIKTMMRLPATPSLATDPSGLELRIEGGSGPRYEQGLDSNVALRFVVAAEVRPWRDRGWRFGVLGDFGASASVDQAGFKGTWSNVAGLAVASWAIRRGRWELGPWLAVGAEHSSLDGTQMAMARTERAFLLAVRGGVAVRYHLGAWMIGAIGGIETLPSTQTYTMMPPPPGMPAMPAGPDVFEVPPFSVVAELVIGVDLAP